MKTVPDSDGRQKVNCGRIDMHIGRDGKWFYHGTPIPRKEMVCLFASTLERRADGTYWLVTPCEEAEISVEDVPFLAVELFQCNCGRSRNISFRTNVDELVPLKEPDQLRAQAGAQVGGDGHPPYLRVRNGLEARLTRSVYYELVGLGCEEVIGGERLFGVWSNGNFYPLGRLDEMP